MLLQRWNIELQALIESFCAIHGDVNPCPEYEWQAARPHLERLLASQGCTKAPSLRLIWCMADSEQMKSRPRLSAAQMVQHRTTRESARLTMAHLANADHF